MSSNADLDLDALERQVEDLAAMQALPLAPTIVGLIQRLRKAEEAWTYWGDSGLRKDNQIRHLEARVAQLERVREAAVVLAEMIERFRPLDGAFGSPDPFRLIEEAQDKLRAALDEK